MPAISDVNDLQDMNLDLAGSYWLANDIDASATVGWNGGAGFIPVGDAGSKFTGIFDLRGHTISDLYIDRPATDFVALFGYTDGATIKKGTLEAPNITGDDCIAPVIGRGHGTVVSNVKVINAIVEGEAYIAAFIGLTDNGCILNKFSSTGSVVAHSMYSGGLIGGCYDTKVSESFSTADVTSTDDAVGGLFGYIDPTTVISDCFARGDVTGDRQVGGAIGYTAGAATVDDSYSTGVVTGNADVGGLIGERTGAPAVVSNCFWDTETSGTAVSDGGTGKTTAEMKTKSTFTDAGWDFIIIWFINGVTNDGYAFHWVMPPEPTPDAPRETVAVQDKITLECVRNVEMAAGGRFRIDKEGKAVYRSRYARNA